uniref:Uncharacterized protein n=1 Tax=Cacopsylla melanoneura TaxID=428564 RepID=A0A8D8UJT0_9HEMI
MDRRFELALVDCTSFAPGRVLSFFKLGVDAVTTSNARLLLVGARSFGVGPGTFGAPVLPGAFGGNLAVCKALVAEGQLRVVRKPFTRKGVCVCVCVTKITCAEDLFELGKTKFSLYESAVAPFQWRLVILQKSFQL